MGISKRGDKVVLSFTSNGLPESSDAVKTEGLHTVMTVIVINSDMLSMGFK